MRLLLLPLCAIVIGCEGPTEIVFENRLEAAIENVRWETSLDTYSADSDARLQPGEASSPIEIRYEDEGSSGVIHFELVANGRRVALVTDDSFASVTGKTTKFA